MKRITEGKYISRGYAHKGYEIRGHGYYAPDRSRWWEAINVETGEADFHAHSKREIGDLIDASERNEQPNREGNAPHDSARF